MYVGTVKVNVSISISVSFSVSVSVRVRVRVRVRVSVCSSALTSIREVAATYGGEGKALSTSVESVELVMC